MHRPQERITEVNHCNNIPDLLHSSKAPHSTAQISWTWMFMFQTEITLEKISWKYLNLSQVKLFLIPDNRYLLEVFFIE